jgi:hypothetical protein
MKCETFQNSAMALAQWRQAEAVFAGKFNNLLGELVSAASMKLDKVAAREAVTGMPYADWNRLRRKGATPDQQAAFEATHEHG